ncbi:MAG: TetR/AcrR family transcriptional regulator [Syntrophobacteraceae bacterium]|nr:TetR/AcrR family transcriptional regulator [Syntrophobacteraceae bacterium]
MTKKILTLRRGATAGTRSERRVREILHIAREVFAEKGFEKATTSEMAQRLGVSEATIFTYFGSKRELCMEVIKGWYEGMNKDLEQEVPLITGIRAQLHFVIRKHLKYLLEEGTGLCSLVLSEGRNIDEEFMSLIADLKRQYTAPFMHALAVARDSGQIRSDIPLRLMRDMVYGSMEHILWGRIVTNHAVDIDLVANQLSDVLWSALISPDRSVERLMQFRSEVADALQRIKEE